MARSIYVVIPVGGIGTSTSLELRDQLGDAAVLAAREQLDRLVVVECLERPVQPDRDICGIHHTSQSVGHLDQLDQPRCARAGRGAATVEPVTQRARPRAGRSGDLVVAEVCAVAHADGFDGKRGHRHNLPVRRNSVDNPADAGKPHNHAGFPNEWA